VAVWRRAAGGRPRRGLLPAAFILCAPRGLVGVGRCVGRGCRGRVDDDDDGTCILSRRGLLRAVGSRISAADRGRSAAFCAKARRMTRLTATGISGRTTCAGEPAAARLQKLAEVRALDVLHDEELPLLLHEVVADARQSGAADSSFERG
jgi:hypothetical protein